MAHRNNAAARTAGRNGAGLDSDHEPARLTLHLEHMHASSIKQSIGADAAVHARTTFAVVHVGVFNLRTAWSLPILKTLTLISPLRHAQQLNHAQIRRATLVESAVQCVDMRAPAPAAGFRSAWAAVLLFITCVAGALPQRRRGDCRACGESTSIPNAAS